MMALIDFDIVAYSMAASAENDPVEVAYMRIDQMIHSILDTTGANTYRGFISGGSNFRHEIYPEYKANRKDMVDPRWRSACKEYLVREWAAEVTDGYEADDALGINQVKKPIYSFGEAYPKKEGGLDSPYQETIICTIDKDLDQVPGLHYSWPIVRKGNVVREGRIYEVSEIEGLRSFYRSLLVGDRTDNIFGVDDIGPVKASKMIDNLETEEEMFERVAELYQGDMDRLRVNGDCLWIQRQEHQRWSQINESFFS